MTVAIVALATGVALVAYGTAFRRQSTGQSSLPAWVFYALLAVGVVVGHIAGAASGVSDGFGARFMGGLAVSLIGSAIYAAWLFVVNRRGDDRPLRRIIDAQRRRLEIRDPKPPQLDKRLKRLEILRRPGPFSIAIFVQLVRFGIAVSALVAPLGVG